MDDAISMQSSKQPQERSDGPNAILQHKLSAQYSRNFNSA